MCLYIQFYTESYFHYNNETSTLYQNEQVLLYLTYHTCQEFIIYRLHPEIPSHTINNLLSGHPFLYDNLMCNSTTLFTPYTPTHVFKLCDMCLSCVTLIDYSQKHNKMQAEIRKSFSQIKNLLLVL